MSSTELNIHKPIKEKLTFFRENKQIPNIIFHGPNGSGKHTLVQQFIYDIYDHDKELIKSYVMNVNCAHGKGIKFVREELKFFAKTHINIKGTGHFKTIILSNADKLTIDAQSAMRRCIELFSHTTRFFIIVDDKYKLLKPILSRFCEIFVPEPVIENKKINLHQYILNNCFSADTVKKENDAWLKNAIEELKIKKATYREIIEFTKKMYEMGYSGLDLIDYIEQHKEIDPVKKSHLLVTFHKVKRDFMNEKLFILFIITLIRSDDNLENISFM
jgi:DNA polymerase III delta prime subunit